MSQQSIPHRFGKGSKPSEKEPSRDAEKPGDEDIISKSSDTQAADEIGKIFILYIFMIIFLRMNSSSDS